MPSNINPQNINGAYPVAGQDNDSQGFRDNFTNTRTNFQFAAAEITDLESKAVLKAALDGTVLNNDMGGSLLRNAQLQDMSEVVVNSLPTTGNVTINYATGSYQKIGQLTGPVILAFTNFPPPGQLGRVRVQIIQGSSLHTLTVTPLGAPVSANLIGTNNIQGMNPVTGTITFNQPGTFEFEFESNDGGTSISIFDLNRNRDPMFLPSLQTFAANGNIDLATTNTVITSSGNLTANLLAANAAEGQIKTLIYSNASPGNCVVNVVDAGWQASGNGIANLSITGSAATFEYINSKWFCIGNNGVTFS